jgi:hypothetical protein
VGIAGLRFRPPPSGGEAPRLREVRRRRTDEWINIVEDVRNVASDEVVIVSGR